MPKQPRTAQIAAMVTPSLKGKVQKAARREGRTVSAWLELATLARLAAGKATARNAG